MPRRGRRLLYGAAACVLLALWLATEGAPAAPCTWQIVPSPNVGTGDNELNAVARVRGTESGVWAVGAYVDSSGYRRTLALRWNGRRWLVVSSPNFGPRDNVLTGIAALSSTNIWAVGYFDDDAGRRRTLVIHWDGLSWQRYPSPNRNADWNVLNSIAAVSSSNIWAVGYSYGSPRPPLGRTLIVRWNGTVWRKVPSPNSGSGDNRLDAVATIPGTKPARLWAVGSYWRTDDALQTLILRWNGGAWRKLPSPEGEVLDDFYSLFAVTALSRTDAWAVGAAGDWPPGFLIAHWDGRAWTRVEGPHSLLDGDILNGIVAVSRTNVFAVGSQVTYDAGSQTLAEHWDGSAWAMSPTPNVLSGIEDHNRLAAVARVHGKIWAVGSSRDVTIREDPNGGSETISGPSRTLVERFCQG